MITNDVVQQTHHQLLNDGDNNDANTQHIVNILGGIDNILTHYLSCKDSLNIHQLHQINEIISTPIHLQQTRKSQNLTAVTLDKNTDESTKIQQMNQFSVTNNYFYHLHDKCCSKLPALNYTTIVTILTGPICFIFWIILGTLYGLIHCFPSFYHIYIKLIMSVSAIIHFVLILLLINRKMFRLLIQSFDYWLKTVYIIIFGLAWWCSVTYEGNKIMMFTYIIGVIANIFVVITVSSIDALYMRRRYKIAACIFIATFFTYACISTYFIAKGYFPSHNDKYHIGHGLHSIIPLKTLLMIRLHTLRVLTIFFYKQAILIAIKPKQSVSVRRGFYIKWIGRDDIMINSFPQTTTKLPINMPAQLSLAPLQSTSNKPGY
eukprot:251504_1